MPSTKSYIVQLISDAGGEYVYSQNTSTSSVPIDLEQAYLLTSKADKWLVMSNASSATEFRNTYPKFVDTKPVASGELYNNNKLVSANGANDYWESGVVHPDLVLRDMLKIMHPDLVSEDFVYYQHLK
jgi:iron complex transport system substrate-binding protein